MTKDEHRTFGTPTRRTALGVLGASGLALVATRFALPYLWRARPLRPIEDLSLRARTLVKMAFTGVDASALWDAHVHLVGFGEGGTGCAVNPDMQSHLHPIQRFQFDVYRSASGVTQDADGDREYLERLLALHRAANPEGKLCLFAFDRHVTPEGDEVPELSPFFTPNEYVLAVAESHADVVAVASVHPYRSDALARLDAAAAAGALAVKWLPNSMGIDPSSPACDAFYRRMAELDLPLITHGGLERAVHAQEFQRLGNPLLLRRALDAGVRVVVAHCASLGVSEDLDQGGGEVESFDLFMRLMGEKQYDGRLFGEISALTLVNRCGRPLDELLGASELHPRLVNGTDYPLAAIDPMVSTRLLSHRGYLEPRERGTLEEIFRANPLLFDFVLKRRLGQPGSEGKRRFAPVVFESKRIFL